MRKRLLYLLVFTCMCLSCATPVGAYRLDADGYTIHTNEETYQFWEKHFQSLYNQEIYAVSADNWNFCADFRDGLLLIKESITSPDRLRDNYVDKNGKLVDLNRSRYETLFSFSQGYAAALAGIPGGVIHTRPTYIDAKGNELMPPSDEWLPLQVDKTLFMGQFQNGRAMVIRDPDGKGHLNTNTIEYNYGDGTYKWDRWTGFEYAYIDTNGKVISKWTFTNDLKAVVRLPLYDKTGVWIGHRMDKSAWGKEAASPPVVPMPEAPKEYQRPPLPAYVGADIHFQSKGKITRIDLGDLDFGTFTLTVTNSTEYRDSGVIAVAAANTDGSTGASHSSGVFFVPYVLAPNSSGDFLIHHRNIIHQYMFSDESRPTGLNAEDLNGQVAARVIHFADDRDLRSFYNAVPYEQNWQPQNLVSEFQPLCNGAAGKAFLKQLRIDRAETVSDGHSFCSPE